MKIYINNRKKNRKNNISREKILSIAVLLVGILFFIRLFNLQIINGSKYREQSNKKILRTSSIEAPRGEIYDRNGIVLATNKLGYDVYIFKTNITYEQLNENILNLIKILDKNNDGYTNNLPIEDNKIVIYNDSQKEDLYTVLNATPDITYKDLQELLFEKYKLKDTKYNEKDKMKIASIRYEISRNSYSLFKGVKIANNISYKSMAMIEEIKSEIPGIEINITPKRYYPYNELASHVLGYVDVINKTEYLNLKDNGYTYNSLIGKTGIELSMEKYLNGSNGILRKEVDLLGNTTSEYIYQEAVSGSNITLTIDYRLQEVAEKALKQVIDNINTGSNGYKKYADATSGAVVALDVNTGEVLAMVSYPGYDPNLFVSGISYKDWQNINNNSLKPMFNRAISGTYSPGSTYKMLTAVAGLQTDKITTTELIEDTGIYKYGHHPKCWIYTMYRKTHGKINVTEAIKVSCNCFFYEVGRRVGIKELVKYSKMFGLGEKTGIELIGEAKGVIAGEKQKNWYLGDTLSASIGQSYNSYTPIQLANYIATLSNGGNLNKVYLVKDISDNDNNSISPTELIKHIEDFTKVNFEKTRLDLDQKNIDAIVDGMKSVTSETGGTSYIVFKNSNIEVAGKTGTAQVSRGNPNGIFVGFAPINNPEIAIVAIIEHGSSGAYSANVVKPILEEYFNISSEKKIEDFQQYFLNQQISF